jgi:hypothetical protein
MYVHVPASFREKETMSPAKELEVRRLSYDPSLREKEPLSQLTVKEYKVWKDAICGAAPYRPREAAQHSQRLQAYVEAAAARAAEQLEPGLRKQLCEALGLQL